MSIEIRQPRIQPLAEDWSRTTLSETIEVSATIREVAAKSSSPKVVRQLIASYVTCECSAPPLTEIKINSYQRAIAITTSVAVT